MWYGELKTDVDIFVLFYDLVKYFPKNEAEEYERCFSEAPEGEVQNDILEEMLSRLAKYVAV